MQAMSKPGKDTVTWTGDLDDDCSAKWQGMLLRAEWMDEDRWWWAVFDLATQEEIDSSNRWASLGMTFDSGEAARLAAEAAAREHLNQRGPT